MFTGRLADQHSESNYSVSDFQMTVRDGLIRMNPSDGVMAEIKKSKLWEKPKRHALTVPQQKAFPV